MLAFGEYRPDVSDYNGQHSQTMLNVFPRGDGYGPVASIEALTDALPAPCRGYIRAINEDGSVTIIAGTANGLWRLNNTTFAWEDVSKGPYNLTGSDLWSFAQFDNRVVAAQIGDPMQVITLGAGSTQFEDLAGDPPQARYVSVVSRFLVASGLLGAPLRIQWSAIDNIEGWTSGTDQSDFQDFADGGAVQGVAGGELGIVFQENAIRRLIYSPGSAVIFQIDKVPGETGCAVALSITQAAGYVFWYAGSGFYRMNPAGAPEPIGKERVDRTFAADFNADNLQLMMGAADPRSSRIIWAYRSQSGAAGRFDKALAYDYLLNRWTPLQFQGEFIAPFAQPGMTLERLDAAYPEYNLDTLPFSLDSFPASGGLLMAAFDAQHRLGLFTGPNLEATLVSAEGGGAQRAMIKAAMPVTDATEVMASISQRSTLMDAGEWSRETTRNILGWCPIRRDTRFYRFKLRFRKGARWTFCTGVEVDAVPTGSR
ncbi:hypothetical protein AZC_0846 [Azorhizobium caulinodans ORS 571]|uniref:Uncharacterized protein n=1 Tax=Azorhizobium caulinodans (strain ATCC 43989 / DSM 5975 / JCM 20966 / LMG 6465 / NBRC 14845 / NCIMB 13405 / ORS 571) TaxID=438753 RepID=A8HTK5_AZOC5|nr:hypothetical protein [Azorhizobium caulinodans]BAF86844.1 hypothetical protein AZC_0846 [Azorhizobium caulinodans ORS 571]